MRESSLEQILTLARKQGAEAAEVYQISETSSGVSFEANRLKQVDRSQSYGLALRIWKEGKPGLAVGYGPVDVDTLVDKAIAISELNPPEEPELAESAQLIYPVEAKVTPIEELAELGKEAITLLRESYPELLCNVELSWDTQQSILVNTKGLYCEVQDYSQSCWLGVEWIRGEDFLAIYDGEETPDAINVAPLITQIKQRLAWATTQASAPKGRYPILLTANAAPELLGTVVSALNGKRVVEQSSPWSEKRGEIVVSQEITLTQEPTLAPWTCPVDDEGTPTQPLTLIDQGRLEQFYCDRTIGKILNQSTTGNGFRPGLGAYPTPGLVNLVVKPGQDNFEQLVQKLDRGIILDQVLGGGPDISGDFSVNLDLGYWVEGGEIIGRVKDTMVSGNVYQSLKQLVALGADSRPNGLFLLPSVIVEGLSITS